MNKCINCGKEATEMHHVVPLSLGGKDISSNKVYLCSICHSLIHGFDTKTRGLEWKRLQKEGIEKAKKEGKYKGKSPIKVSKKDWEKLYRLWKKNEITATCFMKAINLKPNSFYRKVKQYEEGNFCFFK